MKKAVITAVSSDGEFKATLTLTLTPAIAESFSLGCSVMSISDMLSYGYDGFTSAVWNITAGKLPTVKTF